MAGVRKARRLLGAPRKLCQSHPGLLNFNKSVMTDTTNQDGQSYQRPTNYSIKYRVVKNLSILKFLALQGHVLMSTPDVAVSFGVASSTLRSHKRYHSAELKRFTHFVEQRFIGLVDHDQYQPHRLYWTKLGCVRLSFLIHTEASKDVRDWVEHMVLTHLNYNQSDVSSEEKTDDHA